jgi:hypothetical protein
LSKISQRYGRAHIKLVKHLRHDSFELNTGFGIQVNDFLKVRPVQVSPREGEQTLVSRREMGARIMWTLTIYTDGIRVPSKAADQACQQCHFDTG